MTCSQASRQLTAYVDGELDPAAGSALRGHLRECASCRSAAAHEAATLVDTTIDKPRATSEQYLERWAHVIEQRLASQLVAEVLGTHEPGRVHRARAGGARLLGRLHLRWPALAQDTRHSTG